MKNSYAYKSAIYEDDSLKSGFWTGKAIDRQITRPGIPLSNYWIVDFLDSNFLLTPEAGTRRLAVAIREATRSAKDLDLKQEISALAILAPRANGRSGTIESLLKGMNASDRLINEVVSRLPRPDMAKENFIFSGDEFRNHISYRAVELENGVVITADAVKFRNLIAIEVVDAAEGIYRYSAEGGVVDDRLKKTK